MSASKNVNSSSAVPRWITLAFLALFGIAAYLGYNSYTTSAAMEAAVTAAHTRTQALSAQVDQVNERMAELSGRLEVATQKLGMTESKLAGTRSMALKARKEQKINHEKLATQISQVKQENDAKLGQVNADLTATRADLDGTKKDLQGVNGMLQGVKGDLGVQSGLIARNREEVDELKRMGERNIFEFDLRRSKKPSKIGPFQLTLTKVDTRKYVYSMTVLVNDRSVQKRDKTVDEPVQFYLKGTRVPCEIVVFEVSKGRAVGYISTPKSGSA